MWQTHEESKGSSKNGTNRLAWHKVATDLQFVKKKNNKVSAKHNKVKHNKMKYAYTLMSKDYLYDHIGCQV